MLLHSLHDFLSRRSRREILAVTGVLVVLVAALDYSTGYRVSFSIFYLAPVAVAAWYGGSRAGVFTCLVSALVWLWVEYVSIAEVTLLIASWNAVVRLGFFLITALLLSALKDSLGRQTNLARRDGLTALLNRRGFLEQSRLIFNLAGRHGHAVCVAYLDVDNFKHINDNHGHAHGDAVIVEVARAMQRGLRTTDVLGRVGGDEFAIVLPETDGHGAAEVLNDLLSELRRTAAQHAWPIGFSVGAVVFASTPPDVDHAIKEADQLMYLTKTRGRSGLSIEIRH